MKRSYLLFLFLLLSMLLIRLYFFYQTTSKYYNGQAITFETILLTEPEVSGKYQKLSVFIDNREKIFITLPSFPLYYYGDTLRISGLIKKVSLDKPSNQNSQLLTKEKTVLTMFFPKVGAIKNRQVFLLALTSFIRQKITNLYRKILPPTSASLLIGIVFGIKEKMDASFYQSLKNAGVLHVIAASGMNVSMVASFLSSIFVFFLKRQFALVLTIAGILFYALLSGFEPSIVRASLMGILVFGGQILGRQTLAVYCLGLAGYTMLFFSPSLLFDIGFQLSFAATLGLLYLRPLFANLEKTNLLKKSVIGEDLATTVCAQIATLPILLANFGTYSLFSVVANGLVLWMIPFLMVAGSLAALFGFIFEFAAQVLLYISLPFLLLFQSIVTFFGSLPSIVNITIPFELALAYYFFLASFVTYQNKKNLHV